MRYQYTYRNTAAELWQLSMYYMYGSMVGLCNGIFTVAVIALTAARWNTFTIPLRCLLILGCCLFTVIQPFLIYQRAGRQAAAIQTDTWIGFDEKNIYIKMGDQATEIPWAQVKRISKKPTMIILFSDKTHGYVLTNRVLGHEKKDFYEFASSKVQQKS